MQVKEIQTDFAREHKTVTVGNFGGKFGCFYHELCTCRVESCHPVVLLMGIALQSCPIGPQERKGGDMSKVLFVSIRPADVMLPGSSATLSPSSAETVNIFQQRVMKPKGKDMSEVFFFTNHTGDFGSLYTKPKVLTCFCPKNHQR